jgi:hypothetical protein
MEHLPRDSHGNPPLDSQKTANYTTYPSCAKQIWSYALFTGASFRASGALKVWPFPPFITDFRTKDNRHIKITLGGLVTRK